MIAMGDSSGGSALVARAIDDSHWPIHFCSRDLVIALRASNLPTDIMLEDVEWPRATFLFVPPRDEFTIGDLGTITAISITRVWLTETAQPEGFQTTDDVPSDSDSTTILLGAFCDDARAPFIFPRRVRFDSGDVRRRTSWSAAADMVTMPLAEHGGRGERVISEAMLTAFKLVLAMQAQPDLVTVDEEAKHRMQKRGGAFVAPKWIGRYYFIKRQPAEGTHASPRMHWRNGHWRMQAHGDAHKLRKLIWIQPVLVRANASADAS